MTYAPGNAFRASFPTHNNSGASANADSTPTGTLRRNGVNTAESVTVTSIATGDYRASGTIPSGWATGDEVELIVSATVGGVAGKLVVDLGKLVPPKTTFTETILYVKIGATTQHKIDLGVFGSTVTGTPSAQLYIDNVATGAAYNLSGPSGTEWPLPITLANDATLKGKLVRVTVTATVDGLERAYHVVSSVAVTTLAENLGTQGLRFDVTVRDQNSAIVPDAVVNLLDSDGNALNIFGRTNQFGVVSPRYPAGDYQLAISAKTGFSAHTPVSFTLATDGQAVPLTLTRVSHVANDSPDLCNVAVYAINQYGTPIEGATVFARAPKGALASNSAVQNQTTASPQTTDENGLATLTLLIGIKYSISVKNGTEITKFDFLVPDSGSAVATATF